MKTNKTSPSLESVVINTEVENKKTQPIFKYKHPINGAEVRAKLEKETKAIHETLVSSGNTQQKLGLQLMTMRGRFEALGLEKNFSKDQSHAAFEEFVRIEFGLKDSRTREYIRVSLHLVSFDLDKLELSKLVEIARLDKSAIEKLLKDFSQDKLAEMPFRAVQNLVRRYNKNRRDRSKTSLKKEKTKDILELELMPMAELAPKERATYGLKSAINMVFSAFEVEAPNQALLMEIERLIEWRETKNNKKVEVA